MPFLGCAAGAPDVSADGTRISATILGADSTYATQGLWTDGRGWRECMPPAPADGGTPDNEYGSAWGISDDESTLVGLYRRPGHAGPGLAHASAWTEATGVQDLGSQFKHSRANDANAEGTVFVGWDEAIDGVRQSTVWAGGRITHLSDPSMFCEARCFNPAGTIIGGQVLNVMNSVALAALSRWDGNLWVEEVLGELPSTFDLVIPEDMTPDGSIVVGYNQFSSPFSATGFIWRPHPGEESTSRVFRSITAYRSIRTSASAA